MSSQWPGRILGILSLALVVVGVVLIILYTNFIIKTGYVTKPISKHSYYLLGKQVPLTDAQRTVRQQLIAQLEAA